MFEGLRFKEINEVREVRYKSRREREYEEKLIALLDMPLFMDVSADIAALKEEYRDVVVGDGVSLASANLAKSVATVLGSNIDTSELDKPLFRSPMIPR